MQLQPKINSIKNVIVCAQIGFIIVLPISGFLANYRPGFVDHGSLFIFILLTLYTGLKMSDNITKEYGRWWLIFLVETLLVTAAVYTHGGSSSIYVMYFSIIVQMAVVLHTNSAISGGLMIAAIYGIAAYFSPSTHIQWNEWLIHVFYILGGALPIILFVKLEREMRAQNEKLIGEINEANKQLTEYAFQIQELAVTDSLTKLYNQTHAHERFMIEIEIARNNHSIVSIAFFDVDNFKLVNDTYGHQSGDDVLRSIGNVILQNVKGTNYVAARYGGEELIIIMPNTDTEVARVLTEKIRRDIADIELFTSNNEKIAVTVSVGIATFPYDAKDKELLTKLADMAMYQAKKTGKNKIICAKDLRQIETD